MAFNLLKQPTRGKNPINRAQSFQPISDRRKKYKEQMQEYDKQQTNNRSKRSYMNNNKTKPVPINKKTKSSNIFRKNGKTSKSKPIQCGSQPSKIYTHSRNKNQSRDKAMTSADLSKSKQNGLELLQQNWNNRRPYQQKRNQLKALKKKLPKTEFKLLLDEQQMATCYDPVKLYQLNKELMVKNIGTCRVEALTLIISVPKGRKDLTEGIQIIERIIGPVQYIDDDKKNAYSAARNRKHGKHRAFNTVNLTLDSRVLQQINHDDNNDDDDDEEQDDIKLNKSIKSIYSSMTSRQRGASLLSDSKTAKIKQKSKTPRVKLSVQSEIQKRKQTRRYSDDYVSVLRRNQSKSALQGMMREDEDFSNSDDNNSDDEKYMISNNNKNNRINQSISETVMTAVNIEQEWDDFDEIMTQDSLGIRLQAQLLMERKLMLREQQNAMRVKIKKQKEEEQKLQQKIVRHRQNSQRGYKNSDSLIDDNNTSITHNNNNNTNSFINNDNIPDIPDEYTVSTIDELYASIHSNNNNNNNNNDEIISDDDDDDDVYDEEKKNNKRNKDVHIRKMTRESEILNELKNLTNDIDQELRSIDDKILDTQIEPNNNKKISYSSYTNYNNKHRNNNNNNNNGIHKKKSSLTSILPYHRSQSLNEALLRIIHTIENMPKPQCNINHICDDLNALNVIKEFADSFRELLHVTKQNHLSTNDDNLKKENKRRDSVDLKDTENITESAALPNNLDILWGKASNIMDNDNNDIKKKQLKYKLNDNIENIDIDINEYKYIEYIKSGLVDEYNDDLIANINNNGTMIEDENHVLHSLLSQSDLLSEIIFYNKPSIIKHFGLLLKIINTLPFGMQHQRERILATMIKKISKVTNIYNLQQKLLFLYWSYVGNDRSINYNDSDFYLYNNYASIILYGLSSIVDNQSNQNKNKTDNESNFIVESTKCWKRIIDDISTETEENEIILNKYQNMRCNKIGIPSKVLIPSINIHNLRYNKILSQFCIDAIIYKKIYQYKNCNVFDIFCDGYHSNKTSDNHITLKLKSPFLLRIGIECKLYEMMEYIYDLINCIWSSYKYIINITENKTISINNKILFLKSQSITKNIGIWELKPNLIHIQSVLSLTSFLSNINDIRSFAHHFIVSSATIFISAYIMGLDRNEVIETCFIHNQYGDVYQLSSLSVLININMSKKWVILAILILYQAY